MDSIKLIEFAFANFELLDIGKLAREKFEIWRESNQNRIYVDKGVEDTVLLKLETQKYDLFPINKNEVKDLKIEISAVNYLQAPILENDIVRQCKHTNK